VTTVVNTFTILAIIKFYSANADFSFKLAVHRAQILGIFYFPGQIEKKNLKKKKSAGKKMKEW
jgi:hypothetical protein